MLYRKSEFNLQNLINIQTELLLYKVLNLVSLSIFSNLNAIEEFIYKRNFTRVVGGGGDIIQLRCKNKKKIDFENFI